MIYSTFLRTILKLDAASCVAMGAILVPGAAALAEPLGMPRELLLTAGAMLVPLGLFIGWLGTRHSGPAALVWLVITGNVGWTTASLLLAASLPGVSAAGIAVTVAQGLAVLLLAMLEWRGLRGSETAHA